MGDAQPLGLDHLDDLQLEAGVKYSSGFLVAHGLCHFGFNNLSGCLFLLDHLKRLDDAVIAEFCDGRGLPSLMLEIASLRDRLQPPKHVQIAIKKLQAKVDAFTEARRKGADVIHTENRNMKAEVFIWLDSQAKFKSIEAAAMAITKQQPIAHVTGRDWYKEWKKLRSASTP